jgi:hypothetical protein
MRAETSMFAKDHMSYLQSDEKRQEEMRQHDTIYSHFYYYLTAVRGLLPDTAQGIVDDFKIDFMAVE